MEIDKFFTLEEAAAMIPQIRETFQNAHAELNEIRDDIILYKRMAVLRMEEGGEEPDDYTEVLQAKAQTFELCFNKWLSHFLRYGIILRDMEQGLIDFPYKSRDGDVYLLCWNLDDNGLFYFHDTTEGFMGRRPISLLPE